MKYLPIIASYCHRLCDYILAIYRVLYRKHIQLFIILFLLLIWLHYQYALSTIIFTQGARTVYSWSCFFALIHLEEIMHLATGPRQCGHLEIFSRYKQLSWSVSCLLYRQTRSRPCRHLFNVPCISTSLSCVLASAAECLADKSQRQRWLLFHAFPSDPEIAGINIDFDHLISFIYNNLTCNSSGESARAYL